MDLFTSLDLGSIIGYDPRDPIIFTRGFFWAFFAVVLVVFAMVYRSHGPRSLWLFAVSLFFYWKTSGLFVGLLLFSIVLDIVSRCGAEPRWIVGASNCFWP
jgi:alginate O-acetyltransferase complex protein AlgI